MKKLLFTLFTLVMTIGIQAQAIHIQKIKNTDKTVESDTVYKNGADYTYRVILSKGDKILVTGVELVATELVSTIFTVSLTATATPTYASNRSVTWTSSDPTVATVESTGNTTATVKGLKIGTATIKATATDGSDVYAECAVTVYKDLFPSEFSVSASKKVYFTRSNIYWDGSDFQFERYQTDYKTAWDANHVSHLLWTKTKEKSYLYKYDDGTNTETDVPFFAEEKGGLTVNGTSDLYVLNAVEWKYLISSRSNASQLIRVGVTVYSGKKTYNGCLIIAPDDFSETLKDEYSIEEIERLGLLCFPLAGYRGDNSTGLSFENSIGYVQTSTPTNGINDALRLRYTSGEVAVNMTNGWRWDGRLIRLVCNVYK